jgi:nucleoid DNA-binding protein
MKRNEIARSLARRNRMAAPAAQDRLDEIVHKILNRLKKGKTVELRGLGRLVAKNPR